MKVFYIRCSTIEQNEARQQTMAKEQKADKIYIDKASRTWEQVMREVNRVRSVPFRYENGHYIENGMLYSAC